MSARFGAQHVRRGVKSFLIGKVLSSAAGFIALILTVRALSIVEFASYSVLIALVEYITALSGFGLTHIVLRYVPELFGQEYDADFKRFIKLTVLLRLGSLVLLAIVAYYCSPFIIQALGEQVTLQAFQAFLVVATIRTLSFFLSQLLDSTLSQGFSQLAFISSAVSKVVLLLLLIHYQQANLINIILVEAAGELISAGIMVMGIYRVVHLPRTADAPADDGHWLSSRRRQIIRYAITGYLQHLVILPYGGHTNRLLGGHFLSAFSMASYGFAQSLYEYCKRYLPAQLLLGVIRPIIISKYVRTKDFSQAARLTEVFFKANALMVIPLLVVSLVCGPELMLYISKGKYGSSAAILLDVLLVLLLLETFRMQLELLVQAVERYGYLLLANAILSMSILPALYLLRFVDAWCMPVLNIAGLVLANVLVLRKLSKNGFDYVHDWKSSLRLLGIFSLVLGFCLAVKWLLSPQWGIYFAIMLVLYPFALWLLYRQPLFDMVSFLRRRD